MKKIIINICLISLLVLTSKVWATEYFVWGGIGNNNNDGKEMTSSRAWATLAHADDVAGPGDTIYVKGSFSSQQILNNAGSGNGSSWASPVVYRPYEDSDVDFLGDDSGITMSDKEYVEINGFYNSTRRFRFYDGSGRGIYFYSGTSYIRIHGCDFNPIGETPRASGATNVRQAAHHIWIYDNKARSGTGENATVFYVGRYQTLNDADYVYIYDNDITITKNNAVDVKDCPGANEIWIYNNTITVTRTDEYAPFEIAGSCRVYGNTIDMSSAAGSNNFGVFYVTPVSSAAYSARAYIYRNTFIGGGSNYSLFTIVGKWANLDVYCYSNIIKNFPAGTYIANYAPGGGGTIGSLYLYHNTFYNCSTPGHKDSTNPSTRIYAKNNLFNTWGTYAFTDRSNMNQTWDGNHYYKSGLNKDSNAFTWNGTARSFNYIVNTDSQEASGEWMTSEMAGYLDSNGKLTNQIPVKIDVSYEMSTWPDYDLDIDGTLRSGTWDVGASQFSGSSFQPLSPPTGLKIID